MISQIFSRLRALCNSKPRHSERESRNARCIHAWGEWSSSTNRKNASRDVRPALERSCSESSSSFQLGPAGHLGATPSHQAPRQCETVRSSVLPAVVLTAWASFVHFPMLPSSRKTSKSSFHPRYNPGQPQIAPDAPCRLESLFRAHQSEANDGLQLRILQGRDTIPHFTCQARTDPVRLLHAGPLI